MFSKPSRICAVFAVLPLLVLLEAACVHAQAQPQIGSEAEALRRRVAQLEDRVVRLEALIEEMEAALRTVRLEAQTPAAAGPHSAVQILNDRQGWQRTESWRLLRRGLSHIEVRYLLGEPAFVAQDPLTVLWYYPSGARVSFGAETRRVEGWSEW